ncbi:hypothetical protein GTZ99_06320 [Novosphingobium sp. FSY-8]|uniref:Uncharacterized protein n=1 Tax=Novosphingobium ovatum TaxID=1908523 RepID=A0ABW9XC96_9SPHN|nr:hypothetical protein [Novosphingobium ovatum]NBC36171.1 hypothetical protein [Novosphingobium ovatum]
MTMFAYLGPDMPHDLFAASGRCGGAVGWIIDRATPDADRWLESKFPLWTRSVLQDWADGALDHLEAVVFTRADDSAQRLYYYVCELRANGTIQGPEPLMLDIAKAGRASSLARTVASLRALQGRLGVDDAALEAGIAATNAVRAAQAAAMDEAAPLCLIAGTPAPDDRLRAMVRAAGWAAAGQSLTELWADLGQPVEQGSSDPVLAVARNLVASAQGPRAFVDRGAGLVAQAQALKARAVVLWLPEEEEALGWHLPVQIAALTLAGLPHLVLTRRDGAGRDGVDAEIAAFLQGVAA